MKDGSTYEVTKNSDNETFLSSKTRKFIKIAGKIWIVLLLVYIILVIGAYSDKSDPEGWDVLGLVLVGLYSLLPSLLIIIIVAILSYYLRNNSGISDFSIKDNDKHVD